MAWGRPALRGGPQLPILWPQSAHSWEELDGSRERIVARSPCPVSGRELHLPCPLPQRGPPIPGHLRMLGMRLCLGAQGPEDRRKVPMAVPQVAFVHPVWSQAGPWEPSCLGHLGGVCHL